MSISGRLVCIAKWKILILTIHRLQSSSPSQQVQTRRLSSLYYHGALTTSSHPRAPVYGGKSKLPHLRLFFLRRLRPLRRRNGQRGSHCCHRHTGALGLRASLGDCCYVSDAGATAVLQHGEPGAGARADKTAARIPYVALR